MQFRFPTATPLASADVERVRNAFRLLPGIHGIAAAPGGTEVVVQFDEHTTPLPQFELAVLDAGLRQPARAARAGGCCGGCCGG